MADLMRAGDAPITSEKQPSSPSQRPAAAPTPTKSPSGIRGPRMIMQERAAREARRAEAEQIQLMERKRAEQEARLLEDVQRRNPERPTPGTATGIVGRQGSGTGRAQHIESPRQGQTVAETPRGTTAPASSLAPPSQQRPGYAPTAQEQQPLQSSREGQQRQQHQQHQQAANYASAPGTGSAQTAPPRQTTQGAQASQLPGQGVGGQKSRNTFPHAFERWEMLSAHWEGLTSYWLRKLEQNKEDINRDPLSQQLSRQVTDLSAAGANLFHAVVELQRLRASSERKFQRWFFETRAELERSQEVNGMLEAALDKERQDRTDAIRDAVERDKGSSKTQKQLTEMRKELSISKEEARRAWEELGRREQEERDRTFSLQSGQPTIVGGVQVIPMTQAARHGTVQQGYQSEYDRAPHSEQAPVSPTQHEPAAMKGGGEHYYHRPDPAQGEVGGYQVGGSEEGYSEGESDLGHSAYGLGNELGSGLERAELYSDPGAGELVTPTAAHTSTGEQRAPTGSELLPSEWSGAYSEQDYSGEGYGAPGWETMPRHHHPTRLSDVIEEEDERSRTSQVSRGHGSR